MSPKIDDHAGGEHLVQDVDVGGHPGHQPADRIAIVELKVEPLQMAVDLPCRMSNMIRCPVICSIQVCTYSSDERPEQDDRRTRARSGRAPARSPRGDVSIDRELHQVRLRQLQHRRRR